MGRTKGKKLQRPTKNAQAKRKTIPPKPKPAVKAKSNKAPAQHQRPTIPFDPDHRILLIGEGDFSFSRALLEKHNCSSLLATSYDSQSAVLSKYPQAATATRVLEEAGCKVEYKVDATKLGHVGGGGANGGGGGSKQIRKGGFDRIVFNFPHVGGLTKDVNRQVRANQELLVGFFKSALPLLSPSGGKIVVTIFEGEPYDLWNVRDLARHVGLVVERSFKFDASAYPGYKHARTLGNIEGGGGWKGEDRPARTYVFADKVSLSAPPMGKRSHDNDDDSDSD